VPCSEAFRGPPGTQVSRALAVGGFVIWRPLLPRHATILGMTALKQLAFSLAFAIAAVAAAQYIMGILNGQP
jgi:hypothetical protein